MQFILGALSLHMLLPCKVHVQVYECTVSGIYRIVGNFHMVQNFAVFVDKSAVAKIRTTNFSSASYGLLVGVVSPER